MVTKERLEELIEKEATIYQVYADVTVINMKLDKDFKVDDAHLWKKLKGAVKSCGYPLYKLFEIKEEAEWYKEFGNITRTERLELPTWNEIKNDFNNINKFGTYSVIEFDGYYMDIFVDNYANKSIIATAQPRMSLTKENYILACRKAKELFLGEQNEQ